jgi:putative membrane protein
MLVLDRAVPVRPSTVDAGPSALYLWTYFSSVLALAVFFGLPAAALWGAIGMGTVALPLLRALR